MAQKKSKTAKKAVRKPATAKKKAPANKVTAKSNARSKSNGVKKVRGIGAVKGELPFPMKIRGNLYLRFKAAAAELEALVAKTETAQAKVDLLLAQPQHVEVKKALFHQKNVIGATRTKRAEFAQVHLEVGQKLGIPPEELANYTIDSNTGVVLPTAPPK